MNPTDIEKGCIQKVLLVSGAPSRLRYSTVAAVTSSSCTWYALCPAPDFSRLTRAGARCPGEFAVIDTAPTVIVRTVVTDETFNISVQLIRSQRMHPPDEYWLIPRGTHRVCRRSVSRNQGCGCSSTRHFRGGSVRSASTSGTAH